MAIDLVEAVLAYLSNNWNRDGSIVIPENWYRHWINESDSVPCVTIWKLPSPVKHHHLSGDILAIPYKIKLVFRTHLPEQLQEFEDEALRILMLNRTSLTSDDYTPTGIRSVLIDAVLDVPDEVSSGEYKYRRDINIEVLKTPAY